MAPAKKALLVHPDGTLVGLDEAPASVVGNRLKQCTADELKRGQFIVVEGDKKHDVFFMDQKTKERLEKEKAKRPASGSDGRFLLIVPAVQLGS